MKRMESRKAMNPDAILLEALRCLGELTMDFLTSERIQQLGLKL